MTLSAIADMKAERIALEIEKASEHLNAYMDRIRAAAKRGAKIAMYGYSICSQAWLQNGAEDFVDYIVDGYKGGKGLKHKDKPVLTFEEFCEARPDDVLLLVTPRIFAFNKKERDAFIEKCSDTGLNDLVISYHEHIRANIFDYINEDAQAFADKTREVMSMLDEGLSLYTYDEYIMSALQARKFNSPYYDSRWMYMPDELFMLNNDDYIIDCGGYSGDTVRQFFDRYPDLRGISTFEPVPTMFEKLKSTAAGIGGGRARLVNKAVGERAGTAFITTDEYTIDHGGASMLDQEDEHTVSIDVCALDDEVARFDPTFIKMDIEGAELSALRGAADIIKKNHPILAICLYHKPRDIHEIPLYIKGLYPDYMFFIRKYDNHELDLVLYAVPPERYMAD